uniref:Phosphatidic acid phosphatase type 2/haloperoxidase domain-containing protein n=1 Tax=Panagrolaimus sp. ES5 TaxID=591445 RepID=A0AC34FQB4_9BILA
MEQRVEVKPINFICHALFIFSLGASSYLCLIPGPRKLGFFCGDESIRYPYKNSTIPMPLLHATFYIILIPMLIFVERCCTKYLYSKYSSKLPMKFECYGHNISATVVRVIRFFLISQLGYMIDIFLLNITKYSTGRLRPHFLDVCRSSVNTSTISQCGDAATYVEHYMCLGRDEKRITDARLSFFSGHTSHSFYWAMFFSLYLHARIGRTYRTSVAFPVLYTLLFGLAAFVGYSRIFDNKHHVIDVVTGALEGSIVAALMGSIVAALMVLVFFRHQFFDINFKPHQIKDKTSNSESSSETDSEANIECNSITTKVTSVDVNINPVPENQVIEIPLNDDEILPPPSVAVVNEEKPKRRESTTQTDVVVRPKILKHTESHV